MKISKIILNFLILTLFTHTACRKNLVCENGNNQVIRQELVLPTFDRIQVSGNMYVYLKEDTMQKVIVEMESNLIAEINNTVTDGKWRIDFDKCVNERKRVNVYISLPHLKEIRLEGSGEVFSQTDFHGRDLVVQLNGSGKIDLTAFYSHLIVSTNGSGNILLKGNASSVDATISGSGQQRLLGLNTAQARVDINGSGETELSVSQSLSVKISGSGKIRYRGAPSVISSINGSGTVQKID